MEGGMKIGVLDQYLALSWKYKIQCIYKYNVWPELQWKTNRNLYAICRMAPCRM